MGKSVLKKNRIANVPVVMQITNTDCGAASLCMILSYFGKWVTLSEVRDKCNVSRGGTSAGSILETGKNYGLEGKGLYFSAEGLRKNGSFPCILFWDGCHFLVLRGIKGDRVYINDPGRGRVTLDMEEFTRHYSGICLQFKTGPDFKPEGKKNTLLNYIYSGIGKNGFLIALVILTLILNFISVIFAVADPYFNRFFIDRVLAPESASEFRTLRVIVLVILAIRLLLSCTGNLIWLRIQAVMDAEKTMEFMQKLLSLPVGFFMQRTTGDLLMRLKETSDIYGKLLKELLTGIIYLAAGCFYLLALLQISIPLAAIGTTSIIVSFLLALYAKKYKEENKRTLQQDTAMLMSATLTGIEAIATLKSNGAEEYYFQRWAGFQARAHNSLCREKGDKLFLYSLPELLISLSSVQILILGAYYVLTDKISAGSLVAILGIFMLMMTFFEKMPSSGSRAELEILLERRDEVLNAVSDPAYKIKAGKELKPDRLKGAVEIKNLCFGEENSVKSFVEAFNLSVKRGGRVAIIDPEGSASSAIIRMLAGLLQPRSGEILFDGKNRSECHRYTLTGSIGVVLENSSMFDGSVANNMRMWDTTIDKGTLERCAKKIGIHKDIIQKKYGYDALMNTNLPASKLKCIELARVLAQNPSILLLEEPTTGLDPKTEIKVMQTFYEEHMTTIVATRKVSFVRDFDEIIFMDKGKIIERGSWEELINLKGVFAEYVRIEEGVPANEEE